MEREETAERLKTALSEVRGEVRFDEPMSRHTSMRVGGPADALVTPSDAEDLRRVLEGAHRSGIPVFPLGGSNLIVKDGGIRGIVVRLSRLQRASCEGERIEAEAGIPFPTLAQCALQAGLSGLEFAAGIPGTLGGAIVMNAGTHDGEIADVLESVRLVDFAGKDHVCGRDSLQFAYRRSQLPEGVIVGARLALKKGPQEQIRRKMEASLEHRRKTQPLHLPNAGCVFKNPPGDSAGRLVEELGLKGRRVGSAEVSERHGNFIVNLGGASAAEVLALIRQVRARVQQARGIDLELEAKVVGED